MKGNQVFICLLLLNFMIALKIEGTISVSSAQIIQSKSPNAFPTRVTIDDVNNLKSLEIKLDKINDLLISMKKETKIWLNVGKLSEIVDIIKKYPVTDFSFGIAHNTINIEEIMILYWNQGIRVFIPRLYPHGDNPKDFHAGTLIFTKDTLDPESKNTFYHRYINSDFKPCEAVANLDANTVIIWAKPF